MTTNALAPRRRLAAVLALALGALRGAELQALADGPTTAASPGDFSTIDELWADFDPRGEPLEEEVFQSDEEDGGKIRVDRLYFTGQTIDGKKTRVFAYRGAPASGERLPGVLHIHGGGQTANIDWPRYWARRGFVCVSFDFCGDTNIPSLGPEYRREHFTRWGGVQANMMQVGGGSQMEEGPRRNPWHQWVRMARRSLTLLESHPRVDPERLGIFGISVGGTMTWMVAGVDARVKAAVPIYGNGWESYRHPIDGPQDPPDRAKLLWRRLIAPEAYAPRIACPLLFLSATNDGHGRIDATSRTLALVKSGVKRQLYTVGYDHHVEPEEGRSLELWMRAHLLADGAPWPETPRLEPVDAPVPRLRVLPDRPGEVERVDLVYCLNNRVPMSRFWQRAVDLRRDGGEWSGAIPFFEPGDVVFALANVEYESGARVSSALLELPVASLPSARPSLEPSLLISSMDSTADWYFVPAYTDPNQSSGYFVHWRGAGGEEGFTFNLEQFGSKEIHFHIGTHKLGAAPWRGAGGRRLAIDVLSSALPSSLEVRVVEDNRQATFREFKASCALEPGPGDWTTIEIPREQLLDAKGEPLPGWEKVDFLALVGAGSRERPPVFKRLRWLVQ